MFLVRGNHEDPEINAEYGFLSECVEKFGQVAGNAAWKAANLLFTYLPLGALVGERVLCVHGGIGRLTHFDEIRSVARPIDV